MYALHSRTLLLLTLLAYGVLGATAGHPQSRADTDDYAVERQEMVEQIRARGVHQQRLLDAMATVPRHHFVPDELRENAYSEESLPIGWGEFISAPYLSARMIELLELEGNERVLEIGTGSGYDAAVLSRIAKQVYTIEITDELAERAQQKFEQIGYDNIELRIGDGYLGWPEEGPFDAIILTAAPPSVPETLLRQLKVSGRMVVPVGRFFQDLMLITKLPDGSERRTIMPIRLKAMKGEGVD